MLTRDTEDRKKSHMDCLLGIGIINRKPEGTASAAILVPC